MVVIFLIPGPLRLYTAGASTVQLDVSAATVEEALGALWERFPGVRDRVVTEQGEVREYVNIFVGNENIRDSGGLATPVRDGCEIMIVPSVAGGRDG
jgi:adenylyltransferase/sulfurtransferase